MKEQAIKNEFDGALALSDKFERKYLRFMQDFSRKDTVVDDVFRALQSKDIEQIETSLSVIANGMRSSLLLIGLGFLIIDREGLYRKAGCRSYLEYSQRLFEKLEISNQAMSDAKIIMATYIDHYKDLSKVNFKLTRNAHKLKYLDEALRNHDSTDEAYSRAANDTFREFVDWARRPLNAAIAPPEPRISIKIEGGKILVDGQNILNIPDAVPEKVKEDVARYLAETFRIRASGNEPFIVETYGRGEQRAIDNFLKKFRARK